MDVNLLLSIAHGASGERQVTWKFRQTLSGQPEFSVERARGSGSWTTLVTGLFTNTYTDSQVMRWGLDEDLWYRVKMTLAGVSTWSDPVSSTRGWNRKDTALARAIMDKEYMLMRRVGIPDGVLLRRKDWGTICRSCVDPDMGASVKADCPVCFGTGLEGGYWPPVVAPALFQAPARRSVGTDGSHWSFQSGRPARFMAYPEIGEADIWVHPSADKRYLIKETAPAAEIRGVPLVINAALELLSAGTVYYSSAFNTLVRSATPSPGWSN